MEGDPTAAVQAVFSRWTNVDNRWDTTVDGVVSPLDVLVVANYLNAFGVLDDYGTPPDSQQDAFYLDASGDYQVTPLDVLWVIGYLNSMARGESEAAHGGANEARLAEPAGLQAGVGHEFVSPAVLVPSNTLPSLPAVADPLPVSDELDSALADIAADVGRAWGR